MNRGIFRLQWTWLAALWVICMLIFGGCAPKEPAVDPFFAQWQELAQISQGYSASARTEVSELATRMTEPAPEPASEAPLPELLPDTRQLPTQPVTLKMHDVDLFLLLRILARVAGQNMVITEKVQGRVSLNIENTPWNYVFTGLLRSHGLRHEWEGNIIRVVTLDDLKHELELQKITEQEQKVRLEAQQALRAVERLEPLQTRVIRIRYADVTQLRDNLWEMIKSDWDQKEDTSHVRGAILVDNHTNSLIVQVVPRDMTHILEAVRVLDTPVRQVLIEARIVETNRDTARELGIQWGGLYRGTGSGSRYWITPGAHTTGTTDGPLNQPLYPGSGPMVNFPRPGDVLESGLTLGFLSQSLGEYILDVQLSALQKDGRLNILSSPSITTLDNQEAKIASGQEVPFRTIDKDGEISVIFKTAALELTVLPSVIDDERLKINIKTSKDELDWTRTVQGNPTIIKKEAETTLILNDGETTVIGGLTKETDQLSQSGIPRLKDVPILGYLFRSEGRTRAMEDILIFITPHILKERPSPLAQGAPAKSPTLKAERAPDAIAQNVVAEALERPNETPPPHVDMEPPPGLQPPDPSATGSSELSGEGESAIAADDVRIDFQSDSQPPDRPVVLQSESTGAPAVPITTDSETIPIINSVSVADLPPGYTVQLGAYQRRVHAETLVRELRYQQHDPYIAERSDPKKPKQYLVHIGHFTTPESARTTAAYFFETEKIPAFVTATRPEQTDSGAFPPLYAVQVGAFRNANNAHNMAARLKNDGYTASIYSLTDAEEILWYLVRIGEFPHQDDAWQLKQRYEQHTQDPAVVTHVGSLQPVRLDP